MISKDNSFLKSNIPATLRLWLEYSILRRLRHDEYTWETKRTGGKEMRLFIPA